MQKSSNLSGAFRGGPGKRKHPESLRGKRRKRRRRPHGGERRA